MSAWDLTGLVVALLFMWWAFGVANTDDSDRYGKNRDLVYRGISAMMGLGFLAWAAFCAARLAGAHL